MQEYRVASVHGIGPEGHSVTLLERVRGRGADGYRRMEDARIDHGAQFFTVRDPRMKRLLQIWQRESCDSLVRSVTGREDLSGKDRFRGTNGMTGPAKSSLRPFEPKPNSLWIRLLEESLEINERNGR